MTVNTYPETSIGDLMFPSLLVLYIHYIPTGGKKHARMHKVKSHHAF